MVTPKSRSRPMDLLRSGKKNCMERSIQTLLFVSAFVAVIVVFFIILYLFREGYPAFQTISLKEIILGQRWNPVGEPAGYGA